MNVSVHGAKTQLSKLLDLVEDGDRTMRNIFSASLTVVVAAVITIAGLAVDVVPPVALHAQAGNLPTASADFAAFLAKVDPRSSSFRTASRRRSRRSGHGRTM